MSQRKKVIYLAAFIRTANSTVFAKAGMFPRTPFVSFLSAARMKTGTGMIHGDTFSPAHRERAKHISPRDVRPSDRKQRIVR